MRRPGAAPLLMAALVEQVPGRLVRKLDAEPGVAEAWAWAVIGEIVTVTTERAEVVTLRGTYLSDLTQISCSCLLAPKCLHLLAVVSRLPLAEGPPDDEEATSDPSAFEVTDPPPPTSSSEVQSSTGIDAALDSARPASTDTAPDAAHSASPQGPLGGPQPTSTDGAPDSTHSASPDASVDTVRPGSTDTAPGSARFASPDATPPVSADATREGTSSAPFGKIAGSDAPASLEASARSVVLSGAQREAADRLRVVAADTLAAGVGALGAVRQAELLRAVHAARATGLHRLAGAGIRLVRRARDLHDARPDFRLPDLLDDVYDLLATSAALSAPRCAPGDIGVARRAYEPVAGLRLHGLFCEPIVSADGYAGVVTWLCDARGRLFRLGAMRPGSPSRALAAYDAAADFGDVTIAHRRLGRAGLFVQRATASADGRLGGGREVAAAAAAESRWYEGPPSKLWSTPLDAQIDRAFESLTLPEEDRPAGSDLLFVAATVAGTDDTLQIVVGSTAVACIAPSDHPELRYRENLRRLAGAPGLAIRAILRLVPDARRCTAELLAFAPGDPDLRLPAAWAGRVNAGLDALQGTHLPRGGVPVPRLPDEPPPDPLASIRRRLGQIALGGRAAVPPEAGLDLTREAAVLERALLPTGATLLRALAQAATRADRAFSGRRTRPDPALFARAYLATATWERAATRHLRRAAWLD